MGGLARVPPFFMRKFYSYFAAIVIIIFAAFPPIQIHIPFTENKAIIWAWLISGCAGFYVLFLNVNTFVKLLSVYLFINCFFSVAPYLSFQMYLLLVPLIYFYILCLQIEDWTPVIRALKIVVMMNLLLFFMQQIGKDSLCNFGLNRAFTCWGNIGNPMQLKSMLIISLAALTAMTKPKIKYILIGISAFLLISSIGKHSIIKYFLYARGQVWLETIKLWLERPFVGWGEGTFKEIFPALVRGAFEKEGVWRTTHNCWLQALDEIGAIGFSLMAGFYIYLIKSAKKNFHILFSLVVVGLDMMIHFPTREMPVVPIMIVFLAYCTKHRGETWQTLPKSA